MSKGVILIAGGAGYIGSHVNMLLNERGYETVVFDNLSSGTPQSVIAGELIVADLADREALKRLFSTYRFDAVMHFAALIEVGESLLSPARYYRNNVVNTLNLLEVMLEHGCNTFIFSSSAAIFGLPKGSSIKEEDPKNPINPYGRTKLIVESMLQDFAHSYNLQFSSLRYFNAAGGDPKKVLKNHRSHESNLIPILLKSLRYGDGSGKIFGDDYPTPDGTCIRDYIHVMDLAEAHLLAMEQLFAGTPYSFYNLGNGQGFSVKEVFKTVMDVTGLTLHTNIVERRPGDPPRLVADSAHAQRELGWRPHYPELRTIVTDAWEALPAEAKQVSR